MGKNYDGKCAYYFHQIGNKDVVEKYDYLDPEHIGIIIRNPASYKILNKIKKIEGDYFKDESKNFSGLVSPKDFFTNKQFLMSSWDNYEKERTGDFNIKYYVNKAIHKRSFAWIAKYQVPKNLETKDLNKVFIPAAGGSGNDSQVLGAPFYGEPNSVCSQTYLVIGYDPKIHHLTKEQCLNIISYIKTRFFRYLVSIKKKTQNGPRGVYQFVPMQNFDEIWTDEKLYKKYKLSSEEIEFIETMIKPMEEE